MVSNKIEFESLSDDSKNIWNAGYLQGRIDAQVKLDEKDIAIRNLLFSTQKEHESWRAAGLTYLAIQDQLSLYLSEEISFGKLVENIRGLAMEALEKHKMNNI
jgi:hypothetical protein